MRQVCVSKATEEMNFDKNSSSEHHLLTVKQFCTEYPWPSESAMRSYIFRANDLGMQKAFIRVGRRVLVNVNKFFELVQREEKSHG